MTRLKWGNFTRKISRKVENLDEEECNERVNFVEGPLFQKCSRSDNIGQRFLPELEIGAEVRLQNVNSKHWVEHGEIIEKGPHLDYGVRLKNGKVRWRNRRFLRPLVMPAEYISGGRGITPVMDGERQRQPPDRLRL